ncbi:MAG: PilZ domain-containing protein [Bryobacteraceae bacterium]
MERRREPRFKPQQPVVVTILDDSGQHLDAVVQDASGRGLGLLLPQPIEPGKALKIQLEGAMLLAEAVYCQAAGSGFYVGVELDQILDGLASLAKSLEEFSAKTPLSDPARVRR